MYDIPISNFTISNIQPLTVIGGVNVIENYSTAAKVCEEFCKITQKLNLTFIFKASVDKANRSSHNSYRGPGFENGLKILSEIKSAFNVPVITDIHEPSQADLVKEVVDVIQIPAFLSRQTDLIAAAASTGLPINVKKAQFLAPTEMQNILNKFYNYGNRQIMLCERGTLFGYNNLIVDMLGLPIMKAMGAPVIFDVTHSLQEPGGKGNAAGGRRQYALDLAKSAVAQGIAGIFLETHPNPDSALCDGPSALPLDKLAIFLEQLAALDKLAKSFDTINIA